MAQYISQTMTTSNPRVNYRIVVTTKSQSVENNSTTMNVQVQAWRNNSGYTTSGSGTCYCKIQGTQYSNAVYDSQKITEYSYTVLFTKDITIAHSNDGSCTLSLSSYIDHYAFSTSEQSYSVALPTIPRASQPSLSVSQFNIGDPVTIYTNRVSNSFTHDIFFADKDGNYQQIATGVTTSHKWDTTAELYEECPNSPSFSSNIIVKTYNSGTLIGEKKTPFTATVSNSEPICGEVTCTQTDPNVCELVGNYSDIITNRSVLLVTFSSCEAKNFSSISKYCVQIGEKIYESNASEFSVFDFPKADSIICWVKDSRGFTTPENKRVSVALGTFYDYSLPAINNIQLNRENDVYEKTYLSFTANVSEIIADNQAFYITLKSKESGSDTWSSPLYIVNNNNADINYSYSALIGTFNIDKSYDFELTVGDMLDKNTYKLFLPSSRPELSIRNNMVGINCIPTADNGTLQIDGKNLLDLVHPVGSVYMSTDGTSPQTLFGGKWESISDKFLLCAGNTYAAGSTGGAATVTLQLEHMPSHEGHLYGNDSFYGTNAGEDTYFANYYSEAFSKHSTNRPFVLRAGNEIAMRGYNKGGGQAHNNMPPYVAVYCWKRVE